MREVGERGFQGVEEQPAVVSGIELVEDRISRGVDSRSIEGVEARVLSPAPIGPAIALCLSTETPPRGVKVEEKKTVQRVHF